MTGPSSGMNDDLRAQYLERLGLEVEPPSADALHRLHQRHVERVPWETVWIHLGEGWSLDPMTAAVRIAREGRGGYCYHLNGAFAVLLESLGYSVVRHVGGVHGPDGPDEAEMSNHLVLSVYDLPGPGNPAGSWYVDVGLGYPVHSPLPLAAGRHQQGPFDLMLDATPGGVGDWEFAHEPAVAFAGMSWRSTSASREMFEERHSYLSTSPDSNFVKILTVMRRDATGGDMMRGLFLARLGEGAGESRALTTRSEWFGALADVFGLHFGSVPPDNLDRLWDRTLAKHRRWEDSAQS